MYLLKVFYFLYLLCIPLGAMISIFILTRSSIFKFNHIIGSAVILIAVYSIIMYKCPVNITMDNNILLGYIMNFSKECWYVDWSYMLANIITLLVAITQLGNNNIYASGIYIVIIASLLSIAECVMWSINLVIFPQYLFGEITWIMAMLYSLIKVSRK
ncbi:MAG: hypothetical protein Q8936_08065 [Bacillota bacterium]|nr:hypothetical protein [Bacillota bacterium]